MKLLRIQFFCFLLALAACSSAPYNPAPLDTNSLQQQAITQSFGKLTVSAAVPGEEEARAIFGLPLYEHGIQPVWLEITNQGNERVRFAQVSVDRDYYSPLEVAYTLRSGFSSSAREAMDQRFHQLAITRTVDPGETISGFVFTHLSPGTKSFNVDLFGSEVEQNFAFFINVPGFQPDHAEIEFSKLYAAGEIRDLDANTLRTELAELPCCTNGTAGQADGLPVNVVIVANGLDALRALLRANWHESPVDHSNAGTEEVMQYYLFGRKPDAVFRFRRSDTVDRTELKVWLAPVRLDGEEVWFGQVTNFVGQRTRVTKTMQGTHLDPDVDDARNFLLQNMWYSQGLQAYAWINSEDAVPFDQPRKDFAGNPYFTDGYRAVFWLSGVPYSLLKTSVIAWDEVATP